MSNEDSGRHDTTKKKKERKFNPSLAIFHFLHALNENVASLRFLLDEIVCAPLSFHCCSSSLFHVSEDKKPQKETS